jgi:MSHA biogenesis protein MshL
MRKSGLPKGALTIPLILLLACSCASRLATHEKGEGRSPLRGDQKSCPPLPPELTLNPLLATEPQPEKLFSFSARALALEEVLYPLAKEAGVNIIWDGEVNRKTRISISFQDLTFEEALETIFGPTEYLYSMNSPTLHVKLIDTRVFELGYVPNKTTSKIQVGGDVLGAIQEAGGVSGSFLITTDTDADAVDVWKHVETGMKSIVSKEGTYFINKLAGMVTVTDRKKNLKMAENFVASLKKTMNRQVLIEAEVVEVTLEKTQSYGIDWSGVHSFMLENKELELTAAQSLSPISSVFEFTAARDDANIILRALGQYGTVEVLSKPRLNVMNGQTALINVGRVLNYWEITGLPGGVQIGEPVIIPEQQTVLLGLMMGVTPFISSEGYVTLQVVPIVTDIGTWAEFQFQNQTLRAPNVDIREASTIVGIKNGETVVIGGLITSKLTDTEHKIPLLGDLPLLGYFFKRKETVEQRAELVIFLTPRITSLDKGEG